MFGFVDFLAYLNDEHFVVEKLYRSFGGVKAVSSAVTQKPGGFGARVAATGAAEVKKLSAVPVGGRAPVGSGASAPSSPCLHCKGPHSIGGCVPFRTVEPRVKRALVRSNNLCYRCLCPGHLARDCQGSPECDECGGPHHTSLHSVQARQMPVAPVDVAVVPPGAPEDVAVVPPGVPEEE